MPPEVITSAAFKHSCELNEFAMADVNLIVAFKNNIGKSSCDLGWL